MQGSIKVHRLPVFDADGNIVNIISQSGKVVVLSPPGRLSADRHCAQM
jgi:CBS-domain-containing membrane protein